MKTERQQIGITTQINNKPETNSFFITFYQIKFSYKMLNTLCLNGSPIFLEGHTLQSGSGSGPGPLEKAKPIPKFPL